MKKVLLASTALAMTAGMAAADVTLSGYAEIGIADYDIDGGASETVFHNDFDVTFTLSGETDNGLTFGATIDLDEVGDDPDCGTAPITGGNLSAAQLAQLVAAQQGLPRGGDPIRSTNPNGCATEEHSVFVSGDFGTLTMGDTDGAFDWAMQEVWWGTTIADDHTGHYGADLGLGANTGLDGIANGQVARYDYSFGDLGFAISAEIGDGLDDAEAYGIGFKYSFDFGGTGLGLGVGYQDGQFPNGQDTDILGVSLDASIAGGFNARFNYSDGEAGNDFTNWGVGVAYVSGPLLVEANYTEDDFDNGPTLSGWGVAVNYDLGGGAVVMVGYGDSDGDNTLPDFSTFSAGLGLSF